MVDIKEIPRDWKAENARLGVLVQNSDGAARNEMIVQNLGLVHDKAGKYRRRNDYEDIMQEGTVGLIGAVSRFDPVRDVAFATYASPCIEGAIKDYFRRKYKAENIGSVEDPRWVGSLDVLESEDTYDTSWCASIGKEDPPYAEDAERREIARRRLDGALSQLSEEEEEIFLGRQEGVSFLTLGEQYGVSHDVIRGRYEIAERKLKSFLRIFEEEKASQVL